MPYDLLPESSLSPENAKANPAMFGDTGIPALFRATYELGVGKRNIIVKFAGGSHFLEVPDQKQPEVDGRRERPATHLGCVEIPETCLHESIEFASV
ncbi:MAG: hypothetical protein IIB35_11755 [Gemmatimonadetes bacterium]|nr:hypothetical protein [Gemmatimonadota bacterium]